ncbi:MAG: DUF1565 domain-containing protein [Deltaproteobacteria bacterium]|nr:DUF1565 domain-containing protein [Deltaproteobacteria bacterium]
MGRFRWLWLTLLAPGLIACGGDEEEPGGTTSSGTGGGSGGGGGQGGWTSDAGALLHCPPGEWLQDDSSCLAPGVPEDDCAAGFTFVDGGCEAVLPNEDCAAGTMALPGDTACRPVGSCGSGTWGDIPTNGTTQYVDDSFGGTSNGSANAPWKTIGAGIAAASAGDVVAVAGGTYDESLVINESVQVWGVCAAEVVLQGGATAVTIAADAAEIHGLAITGNGMGVRVDNAASVVVADVWLHDLSADGVYALGHVSGASLHLEDSLVENTVGYGLQAVQADVTIARTAIRDVAPLGNGNWGVAVLAYNAAGQPKQELTVEGSHFERTRSFGLVAQRSMSTTVTATLIRDVDPAPDGLSGTGILQQYFAADGDRADITVTGVVIERTHRAGISIGGGDAIIEGTTIRDIDGDLAEEQWGAGVDIWDVEDGTNHAPTCVLRGSLIDSAFRTGVQLYGAEGQIESIVVRDTKPRSILDHGFGVIIYDTDLNGFPSTASLVGSRIERTYQSGIIVAGSTATIDSTAVLDTQPTALSGAFGVGISVMSNYETLAPASATVTQTVVDGAYAGGLVVGGGDLVVEDVVVRNILPQVNVDDFGDGIGASSTLVWIPDIIPTTLDASRVTVQNAARAGMSNFGATVGVGDSFFDCNQIDLDGEPLDDLDFVFDDLGGNDCGCGVERVECKVLSTNIEPPFSF